MWKLIIGSGRAAAVVILIVLLGSVGPARAAEFWLRAEAATKTMPDGRVVPVWGYALDLDNDFTTVDGTVQVPGPELSVPAGESLTIHLKNNLPEPTSLVIPGQIPDSMNPVRIAGGDLDGRIRSFTAEAEAGGGEQTYTWTAAPFRSGTFLYQSGSHPGIQVPMGLYGAVTANAPLGEAYPGVSYDTAVTLLFSEIDPAQHAAVDALHNGPPEAAYGSDAYPGTLVVGYQPQYFLVNGAAYAGVGSPPAIPVSGTVLLRLLNAGSRVRMPVVEGVHLRLVAEDGNPRPFVLEQASPDLPAGTTADALVQPAAAGLTAIYDRALGLSNAGVSPGGMYAFLQPTVTVVLLQPNGGDPLTSGTTTSIEWTPTPGAAGYELAYSLDGGTGWTTIATVGTVTSHLWTVPAVAAAEANSLVRVRSLDDGAALLAEDQSDAPFTISPSPVQLLAPNGSETLTAGTVYTIQWTGAASATGYALHYSFDGGSAWTPIAEVGATTSYDWTVPFVASTQENSLVRVTAFDGSGSLGADASDSPFTIAPSPFRVLSPNGGENLATGTVFTVRWNPYEGATGFWVEYSIDGGGEWTRVGEVGTTTNYDWTVPFVATPQGNSRVQVWAHDADDLVLDFDQSDAPFTIAPSPVQVVAPNGGETLTSGTVYTIQWTAAAGATGYSLDYSMDGGTSWTPVAQVGATSSYGWTVPVVATIEGNCLVRATATGAGGVVLGVDTSDAPFTIAPPAVQLMSPDGGETLASGTPYLIQWTDVGAASYSLEYSMNGGTSWTLIQQVAGGTSSYSWMVPSVPSPQTNSLVRVSAYDVGGSPLSTDMSNAPFTIAPAQLRLITPNGGETLNSGITYQVQWTAFPGADSYQLEYSTNNGAKWTSITQGISGGATNYGWSVPSVKKSQPRCLVRVSAYAGGTMLAQDVSDGMFTIAP
jgi:FtsP/CotA-like multicopper oxidase with cupredoxin domain